MVSPQPAAKPTPDMYGDMTDADVLYRAKTALARAERAKRGSASRHMSLVIFDSAMAELARRAMMHVLWKIHENEKGSDDQQPLK